MINKFARFVRKFISAPNSSEPRLIPFSVFRGNGRLVGGAVLSIFLAGTLSAAPRFSPGFTHSTLYARAGDPGAWAAGIQSFDFGSDGTLYVFAENRYIVMDPAGVNEVLYDFGFTTWGSFLKLDNNSPQNVWFGESMTNTIQSVVSNGGASQTPTSRGTREYNFDMAVNSANQVFMSANTGWSDPNKIWFWTGAAWQELAGMDGSSGPITFDSADNLYYGFAQYNSTQEEVVYFTDEQVQPVISGGPVLSDADAVTYAQDMNTNYGLAYEAVNADIFSSSSLGTVTRITGLNEWGPFGCGSSPSVVRCYGGNTYVLCTDWSDYESTIFRLQPHSKIPLAVMKNESGDYGLYVYNAPAEGDWKSCDASACNPSALDRDMWMIPSGNDTTAMVAVNADGVGEKEIAVLKNESGDWNLYLYNAPVEGDWTYWDAQARNPSPLARDLWNIPYGNDIFAMAAADISDSSDGVEELIVFKRQGGSDVNLYVYNAPDPGDWSMTDADARNPSPLARDFWFVPRGNDAVAMAAVDTDGDVNGAKDRLLVVRDQGGDYNTYLWNLPAADDWTYGDAESRNPSPVARDFWQIPSGNDVKSVTSLDVDGDPGDELVLLKEQSGDQLLYIYNTIVDGDWNYGNAGARNPSPLARDFWQIPSGNSSVAITGLE